MAHLPDAVDFSDLPIGEERNIIANDEVLAFSSAPREATPNEMTHVKRAMIDNVNAGRADTANDGVRRSKELSREVNRLAEQCALSQPDTSNLHEAFEAVDQKKKKRTHPRQIS